MAVSLPEQWNRLPIGEAMDAIIDYRGKSPRKTSVGVPLVTAKIVKGGRILQPQEFIDPEDYDEWMRRGLPLAGDVVMTTEAPLGEIAQLDGTKIALAQRLITLRGAPSILDNTFLKFAMQSDFVQDQLRARATGTTVQGIRQSELRKVVLPLPPLSEQRAIGAVLGSMDRKLELNRRTNETLEATARAVFKSWFVDFDPVRAKAEGRKPEGMDAKTAALFPDDFEESSLGEIPEGWKVYALSEVVKINPRRSLPKGEEAPYLEMKAMPTSGHRAEYWWQRPFTSGVKFINGDTLLARITPCLENGKTAYVDFLSNGVTGWGSTEYIVFSPQHPLPAEYGYFLARSESLRTHAIQNMSGTSGRQRVPPEAFRSFMVAVPPKEVCQAFGQVARRLLSKIRQASEEAETLKGIRDALLPKLLSGELRVKDAARHVKAVV